METEDAAAVPLDSLAQFYLIDAVNLTAEAVRRNSERSKLTHLADTAPAPQTAEGLTFKLEAAGWEPFLQQLLEAGEAEAVVEVAAEAGAKDGQDAEGAQGPDGGTPDAEAAAGAAEGGAAITADAAAPEAPEPPRPNPITASVEASQGDWGDIELLKGAETDYLFSERVMTRAYAQWAFLAEEGDDLATFAFCVREDSRLYPRPMALESLENPPFRMTAAHIEELFQRAQAQPGLEDLERCEASNGDVYFYSTQHLSPQRARSLAERRSVLIPNNP